MTRQQLKASAKQILANNYWRIIGITVLYLLISSSAASIVGPAVYFLYPLYHGVICLIVSFSDGNTPSVGEMFTEGFNGTYYLRRVGGMAWMELFIFLWSLLFGIPGIVKSYSYAMTPYILAKYPEIPAKEALRLSMKIMDGRKATLFVIHLSFIGWAILSLFTMELLSLFFVTPYMIITEVLWFKNVMKEVTESGEFVYTAQPSFES